jgi:hypothetical protein
VDLSSLTADGFGHWLAGLIDGEGSFTITPNRPGFVCRLSVGLRADDREVLSLIVSRTGLGKCLGSSRSGGNRKPLVVWRVQRKEDCQAVVELLRLCPLRSKKARDFEIWAEAVAVMAAMQPVHTTYWERRALDWKRVAELKKQLAEVREFREVDLRHAPVAGRSQAGSRARSEALHR